MKAYDLTPSATRDIFDIWNRVARDSFTTADEVEAAIYDNCEVIASSPGIGHKRRDCTSKNVLIWPALPYKSYQVVYRVVNGRVEVMRVLHAARQRVWKTL